MSEQFQAITALEPTEKDNLRKEIEEVSAASLETDELLYETADPSRGVIKPLEPAAPITDREIDYFRDRANKQRQRGQRSLARRYDGIASVMRDVAINERVIASAFERFFPIIEKGLYLVAKSGETFLGHAIDSVNDITKKKIEQLESSVNTDLAAVQLQLSIHESREGFVRPEYFRPAVTHRVQLRHVLANRVLEVYLKQDQVIAGLQVLNWNGESDAMTIDEQEQKHKRETRELATHLSRTLRAMRNKVTAPPAKNAANGERVPAADTVVVAA